MSEMLIHSFLTNIEDGGCLLQTDVLSHSQMVFAMFQDLQKICFWFNEAQEINQRAGSERPHYFSLRTTIVRAW
jgi:hypothetical protein